MTANLPAPLIAADVDLTDFAYMQLDVRRLRDSRIASALSGEGFRCSVLLWCAAWHQKPAGSLPDDDLELSQLAGFGRAVVEWQKIKAEALYGWVKCSDDRYYHPVVCEKADKAWAEKQIFQWKRECDRIRKTNSGRKEKGLDPLEMPPSPAERLASSAGSRSVSAGKPVPYSGLPAENALKGEYREKVEGEGYSKDAAPLRDAAVPSQDDPPSQSAAVISTPEADLYRRGKEVLGSTAGGMVKRLLKAQGDSIALARAAIETASEKGDPREYIGAIIGRPNGRADRDLGVVRSSRDM